MFPNEESPASRSRIADVLTVAVLASTLAVAACENPVEPEASEPPAVEVVESSRSHQALDDGEFGTTPGWFRGELVEFSYSKEFFCRQPPSSQAVSGCAMGAEPETAPRPGEVPVLYVMTPLGFRPEEATLHCPVVGECINHPSTLDASRVLGPGTEEIPLPAHSHIVDELQGNWWEIEVIGVPDPAIWGEIVQNPSLEHVRELQAAGEGITGDIPTNLFLFFNVRKGRG